jgi:hypothetical protein
MLGGCVTKSPVCLYMSIIIFASLVCCAIRSTTHAKCMSGVHYTFSTACHYQRRRTKMSIHGWVLAATTATVATGSALLLPRGL